MDLFDCEAARKVAYGMIIVGIPIFFILVFVPAWYGRYGNQVGMKLGSIPAKAAWILQECPSFFIPTLYLLTKLNTIRENWINVLCLCFYLFHYFNRSFIFPLRIKNGKNTPTEIVLMAFVFCLLNGYIQAVYLINPCTFRTVSWLYDVRFILGACLFILGMAINWNSDSILRNLRSDGSSGYKIPHGGLFEYISGANYFGECLEWIGYAILCWNLAGVAFAIFTIANIGPRAWQHHLWYKKTFGDEYPANRKAIIPFLV